MTHRKSLAIAALVSKRQGGAGHLLPSEVSVLRSLGGRQVRKLVKWAREVRTHRPRIHRRPATALRHLERRPT